METWLKTCLFLCLYGFFKELRPSEPFLTEYLLSDRQNLTESQVYYEIYPVWTYSYLSLLIAVFLLTDLLRYKPVIVFEGIGYIATWSLLIWAKGVRWMQLMEFCYGIATSTEVAYYTYIYAQVSGIYYQKVTSYTRTAILTGRFCSAAVSQILFSTKLMDYYLLNYISLVSVSMAFVIAVFLPSTQHSVYFHRDTISSDKDKEQCIEEEEEISGSTVQFHPKDTADSGIKLKKVATLIWKDFKEAYSNTYLLKWSVWWAFASCGNFQVGNYIQPLWESIESSHDTDLLYNGAVEALQTLLSAIAAFAVGYLHLNWPLLGEIVLALISLVDGVLLLFMGLTSEIWVAYINYVVFRVSYQVLITIASFQVARELKAQSYGLVFGINMFMALFLQAILTLVVINILTIDPATQFVIYGCYFCGLAFFFLILALRSFLKLGFVRFKEADFWIRPIVRDADVQEAPVGTTESV